MGEVCVHRVDEGRTELLAALAAVRAATDAEVSPTDPPMPVDELAGELFAGWTRERRHAWLATVEDEPAGELTVRVEDGEENRDRVDVESLAVVPGYRRGGVADALVRAALDWADAHARPSLTFWVPTGLDGAGLAYAERLGASRRMQERCSRLRLDGLHHDVVDRWRREGRARTDGYRLVRWVGPVPDEHLELMVTVHRAMEDMPTDELDWTIEVVETYNAESNPWMLDINVAMGFRPHMGYEAWQVDSGVVRGVLAR